jgi:hypothetical protein
MSFIFQRPDTFEKIQTRDCPSLDDVFFEKYESDFSTPPVNVGAAITGL